MHRTTCLDYETRRKPKTTFVCVACMRDLDPARPYRLVTMVGGEALVIHPEDVEEARASLLPHQYLEVHPIGSDCARRLGLEWTTAPVRG